MGGILNYASSPFLSLTATARFPGYGAVAVLQAQPFDRYLSRVLLNCSVTNIPADIVNTDWDNTNKTILCWFLMGGLADNNSIIDATYLGDQNLAEYVIPILIPRQTDFYIRWPEVRTAAVTKCTAMLTLATK